MQGVLTEVGGLTQLKQQWKSRRGQGEKKETCRGWEHTSYVIKRGFFIDVTV